MSPVVEYLWKASIVILFLHTILVTGDDQVNDDASVDKRRSPGFRHMFVGKRWPLDIQTRMSPKYGYYFVGKRLPAYLQTRLSPKFGRYFVGKRPHSHRMFVGKRVGDDAGLFDNAGWEDSAPYGDLVADDYYGSDAGKGMVNPFVYFGLDKNKAHDNAP